MIVLNRSYDFTKFPPRRVRGIDVGRFVSNMYTLLWFLRDQTSGTDSAPGAK